MTLRSAQYLPAILLATLITISHSNEPIQIDPLHRITIEDDALIIGQVPFHMRRNHPWNTHLHHLCSNGDDTACHYDEMLDRIQSTAQDLIQLQTSRSNIADEERDDFEEMEWNTLLIRELTLLYSFHKNQLDQHGIDASSFNLNDSLDSNGIIQLHYNRALGSLLACNYYHSVTWELLQNEDIAEMGHELDRVQIMYERHAISLGALGVNLHLSDLFERYYAIYQEDDQENGNSHPDEIRREGYTLSYKYVLACIYWCEESRTLLNSIDLDGSEGRDPYETMHREQLTQSHQVYAYTTEDSCANANTRMGTLLLTMYAEGYVLNEEEMLSFSPVAHHILLQASGYYDYETEHQGEREPQYSNQIVETTKLDQKRLLLSIIDKIQSGIETYNQLTSSSVNHDNQHGDNRIDLAGSHYHLGMAHHYLGDDLVALSEWKSSLKIYRNLFHEYTTSFSSSGDTDVMAAVDDIVLSLITTTQECCTVLLSLGHYEETKEMYRLNLKLRRYLSDGTSIEVDLTELDDDGKDADYLDQEYDKDGINLQFGEFSEHASQNIDVSINEHQKLLDEYSHNLQSNPYGSYEDMLLDTGGMTISDNAYEGSLRLILGSLHLAKNNVRVARDELELAVSLLKKGIQDEESGMWDTPVKDVNGNEMLLSLYLADALFHLSYAQSGMSHWYSSMLSFGEALDFYEKELSEGESPFGRRNENGDGRARDHVQQRDGLVDRRKQKLEIKLENYDLRSNNNLTDEDATRDEL